MFCFCLARKNDFGFYCKIFKMALGLFCIFYYSLNIRKQYTCDIFVEQRTGRKLTWRKLHESFSNVFLRILQWKMSFWYYADFSENYRNCSYLFYSHTFIYIIQNLWTIKKGYKLFCLQAYGNKKRKVEIIEYNLVVTLNHILIIKLWRK